MSTLLQTQVQIIPYREEFKETFKKVNYEWIAKYFEITPLDKRAFNNPKKEILDKNGYIYLAMHNNKIIGSVALEKITTTQYALTKMGVDKAYQGRKVGQLLIDTAIKKSKELTLTSVVLYTNQVLINALNLYFKNGFKVVPLDEIEYKRATIKMELKLS